MLFSSIPFLYYFLPLTLLCYFWRRAGQKCRSAPLFPCVLCVGRAEICPIHGRIHSAGLFLWAAGRKISYQQSPAVKALFDRLGPFQPAAFGLLQVRRFLHPQLQCRDWPFGAASAGGAAHWHQLLHLPDPQLCGGCPPGHRGRPAQSHRPRHLYRHVPAAHRGAHRPLCRYRTPA